MLLGVAFLATMFGWDGGTPAESDPATPAPTRTRIPGTPTPATVTQTTAPLTPTATPTPYGGTVARVQLEAFGVDAQVEEVAIDANNVMETPVDPLKVGWYYIYDRPGWGGNAVFSAHVDYWPNIKGPFNRLDETEIGDRVDVVMADGTRYIYEVFAIDRYEAESMPTGDIIEAPSLPPGEEWITLITCGGDFVRRSDEGWGDYLHRDVVIARLVQSIPA
jgi:hypothetical protein